MLLNFGHPAALSTSQKSCSCLSRRLILKLPFIRNHILQMISRHYIPIENIIQIMRFMVTPSLNYIAFLLPLFFFLFFFSLPFFFFFFSFFLFFLSSSHLILIHHLHLKVALWTRRQQPPL